MTIQTTFRDGFLNGKAGLRCIGDVHGDPMFANYVAEARAKNYAILQMGDIVDRGIAIDEAIRTLIDIIDAGDGEFVPGNHDWRYYRYLIGNDIKLSRTMDETFRQVGDAEDRAVLEQRFREIMAGAKVWHRAGNYVFAHGGVSNGMLVEEPFVCSDKALVKQHSGLFARAIYGQTNGSKTSEGYPARIYDWLDGLPGDITAVIGHDSKTHVYERVGQGGGRVIYTDTGAGKGGRLSYYDIAMEEFIG
jgi:protein phosphatase